MGPPLWSACWKKRIPVKMMAIIHTSVFADGVRLRVPCVSNFCPLSSGYVAGGQRRGRCVVVRRRDRVETRRPATVGAAFPAVTCLVGLVRDSAADPAWAQVGTVLAGGVRLVGTHPIGADARSARSDAGHADLLQHGFELRRVPTLPCGHRDRHGRTATAACTSCAPCSRSRCARRATTGWAGPVGGDYLAPMTRRRGANN